VWKTKNKREEKMNAEELPEKKKKFLSSLPGRAPF
jgi:hypothetical protein